MCATFPHKNWFSWRCDVIATLIIKNGKCFSYHTLANGMQRNLTECKISTSFTKFVFFRPIGIQDGRPGLWLAATFPTAYLKPWNGMQQNLTGSKILTSSTWFLFFGPIGNPRLPPWPLIVWDILIFFSATAEWYSTKIDGKQDLNVLYQVCLFSCPSEKQDVALALDTFQFFSPNPLIRI